MDEKRNAVFTICVLSSILLFFTLADLFHGDRLYSETENRVLASRPEFSAAALLSGDYTSDYETYVTDQFVGRDKWIDIKTKTDLFLGKRTINGVYLGADDYLIERHLPQEYPPSETEEKLELWRALTDRWDAAVMLIPTADNILTDKLPACAPYYDETPLLESALEIAGERGYVDVFSALCRHRGEEIYYRTDHHWTSLGAYYGYLAWAQTMGEEPFAYDPAGMETAAGDFQGTLQSRLNLKWPADSILYFPETMEVTPQITYDGTRDSQSYYEESHLDTKNKYGFFLDGNHGLTQIDTGYDRDKTLIVLKDSYGNCLIPLLAPHYGRILALDLRYYNGRLFPLLEQYAAEGDTDVLVVYNCVHFLEDFLYY